MPLRNEAARLALIVALLPATVTAAPTIDFGAALREQGETISSDTFGIASPADDAVWLHRLLLHADLRSADETLRAYVQLGAYAEGGRNGGASPVDESAPDLHQGYVELPLFDPRLRLRAGRQEWSFGSGRLVSVRDGPNIRRAFDAVQVEAAAGDARVRALYGRPVANEDGAFDDEADRSEALGGVYAQLPLRDTAWAADLDWLHYRRDQAEFAAGIADERRDSYGLRLYGEHDGWNFNTELVWQSGRFGGDPIRAWTIANDSRYRFEAIRYRPRIGFKLDLASGDADADDGRLGTFNALYPNPSYFSDAALIAPANLIDLQPYVQLTPLRELTLYAGWNLIWKHRRADAVYTTPVPLNPVPGSAGGARFVGHQLQLSAQWAATEHLQVEGSYVRFNVGDGLREAGGDDVDFVQLVLSLTY